MAKEHFFYRETEPLFKKLELLSRRSGVSRGQAFEDFLTAMVCALAAGEKKVPGTNGTAGFWARTYGGGCRLTSCEREGDDWYQG